MRAENRKSQLLNNLGEFKYSGVQFPTDLGFKPTI